jgi:hypothetical protein
MGEIGSVRWLFVFAVVVTTIVPANSQPALTEFSLDMDSGVLAMMFSSAATESENFLTGLTLQSSMESPVSMYTLTGGTTTGDGNGTITVTLTTEDLNFIKADEQLAVSVANTFLSIADGIVSDDGGASIAAVLQATIFLADMTEPELVAFSLDVNAGELALTFSEPVSEQSFNVSGITLLSSPERPELTLTDTSSGSGSGTVTVYSPVITVLLDTPELNYIKLFAHSWDSTYLILSEGSATDSNGNENLASTSAIQVSIFTPDTTRPVVVSFGLDLNTGILILTFSETVNVSTIDITALTIQSDGSGSGTSHTLVSGLVASPNSDTVTIFLTQMDLNVIKSDVNLATSQANTFLSFSSSLVQDMYGSPVVEVGPEGALVVAIYAEDVTPPTLVFFDLDLGTRQMNLTFNEPVDISTFDAIQLTLQSAFESSAPSYSLTGSASIFQSTTTVVLTLTDTDFYALQESSELATSVDNTFLSFPSNLVQDLIGNLVVPISAEHAIPVRNLVVFVDDTPPEISTFSLDLNRRVLSFAVSEEIDTLQVRVTAITFRMSRSNSSTSYTLTGSQSITQHGNIVNITLSNIDLAELHRLGYTTTTEEFYLSVLEGLVTDRAGNPSAEIPVGEAVPVSDVIRDTTAPHVTGFNLDLNLGVLNLFFSEIVNTTSLDVSGITLQSSRSGAEASYSLTSENLVTGVDFTMSTVHLSVGNLNAIKSISDLATSSENAFLLVSASAILDLYGNPSVQTTTAVEVTVFVRDSTSPEVLLFDLDMDAGLMNLTFDEPVLANSLNPTSIILQSTRSAGISASRTYTLTGGAVLNVSTGPVIYIKLTEGDVDGINMLNIAVSVETAYLAIGSDTIVDTSDNPVVPIPVESALQVSTFVPLVRIPTLTCFDLDMDEGRLRLSFNKIVVLSRLDVTGITLQSASVFAVGHTVSYTLTNGTFDANSSSSVDITLSSVDFDSLKVQKMLSTESNNTFLSVQEGIVIDNVGNNSLPIAMDDALPVCSFQPDSTAPELMEWSLNLISDSLSMTFSEPVDVATLDIQRITIQARQLIHGIGDNFRIPNRQLKSSRAESTSSPRVVTLKLNDDAQLLKGVEQFCSSTENTFLSCTAGMVRDYADNSLQQISFRGSALQVTMLTIDTIVPVLVDFTLDISNNGPKELVLTFSEPVLLSTVKADLITIPVTEDTSSEEYTLTTSSVKGNDESSSTVTLGLSEEDWDQLCSRTLKVQNPSPVLYHAQNVATDINLNKMEELVRDRAVKNSKFVACSKSSTNTGDPDGAAGVTCGVFVLMVCALLTLFAVI